MSLAGLCHETSREKNLSRNLFHGRFHGTDLPVTPIEEGGLSCHYSGGPRVLHWCMSKIYFLFLTH